MVLERKQTFQLSSLAKINLATWVLQYYLFLITTTPTGEGDSYEFVFIHQY